MPLPTLTPEVLQICVPLVSYIGDGVTLVSDGTRAPIALARPAGDNLTAAADGAVEWQLYTAYAPDAVGASFAAGQGFDITFTSDRAGPVHIWLRCACNTGGDFGSTLTYGRYTTVATTYYTQARGALQCELNGSGTKSTVWFIDQAQTDGGASLSPSPSVVAQSPFANKVNHPFLWGWCAQSVTSGQQGPLVFNAVKGTNTLRIRAVTGGQPGLIVEGVAIISQANAVATGTSPAQVVAPWIAGYNFSPTRFINNVDVVRSKLAQAANRVVTVVYMGDSHTERTDTYCDYMHETLETTYGTALRLPRAKDYQDNFQTRVSGNICTAVTITGGSLEAYDSTLVPRVFDNRCQVYTVNQASAIAYTFVGVKVVVVYEQQSSGGSFDVIVDGSSVGTQSTNGTRGTFGRFEATVPSASHSVVINTTGSVRIYAFGGQKATGLQGMRIAISGQSFFEMFPQKQCLFSYTTISGTFTAGDLVYQNPGSVITAIGQYRATSGGFIYIDVLWGTFAGNQTLKNSGSGGAGTATANASPSAVTTDNTAANTAALGSLLTALQADVIVIENANNNGAARVATVAAAAYIAPFEAYLPTLASGGRAILLAQPHVTAGWTALQVSGAYCRPPCLLQQSGDMWIQAMAWDRYKLGFQTTQIATINYSLTNIHLQAEWLFRAGGYATQTGTQVTDFHLSAGGAATVGVNLAGQVLGTVTDSAAKAPVSYPVFFLG